mmetsp:Transcript_13542/g.32091  ORF Transcript_13542/g.32091 Transcript_13542/m.32091 type:complete len:427 (-) Transcript_13542:166-1446(-)
MAPSKTTTDTDGFDHTSVTCKAFAALLCVSSVAVGCTVLVSALKTQDPIGIYRPDAVRRELPRDGPFMAVETANPRGLHGPGAVSPTKEEFQAHLGEFAKKKGAGWLFNRKHRGKGGGGRGKGKGGGRGGGLPFGHAGMRGPTGDFLWDRGAGRRGHHVESGIGPMQVQAADYDEEEAMGKVRGCLLNLDRSGAQMVPGERGFYPSPAKWAEMHEGNVEAVQTATRRSPQPRQLFLGDSITRGLAAHRGASSEASSEASVLALGISGDTTTNLLWRIRHGELPRNLRPEKVAILIGANDFTHGRELAIDAPLRTALSACAIIRHVRHQGLKAPITLTKILPRGKQWPHGLGANATRRANALLEVLVKGAAADFRVRLVDCGGRFVLHPPEDSRDDFGFINERLMPDRVHMSPAGYAEWDACLNADV